MAANFPGFSRLGVDDTCKASAKRGESAPELLYKMCKKIAQLTKVVYVLNTRNDDLEMQCKSAVDTTDEKVNAATAELKRTVSHLTAELEKKIDLNDRVKGLEETLKLRDQELRKLLDEIAAVRKRQEERERELSSAYRIELRQAAEAQQLAERRLAQVVAEQKIPRRLEFQHKDKSEEEEDEETSRKRSSEAKRNEEVEEFRRLIEQLQVDLKEKTERWEAVAKEERSKLEAQLERAKKAKEEAEELLAQQLAAESQKNTRNLVSQEARYQEKLSELSSQLAAKDCEANRLRLEIEELKTELVAKVSGMDRLQAELSASDKEGDQAKKTLRKLEDDVTEFRHKNSELEEELQRKEGEIDLLKQQNIKLEAEKRVLEEKGDDSDDEDEDEDDDGKVAELEERIRELEETVAELTNERDHLSQQLEKIHREREEEMKLAQAALDEALAEKVSIQSRFERDFEKLRTVNADREQQLLDDFEWKLREVEGNCKRRLEEKDKAAEEILNAVREEAAVKLAQSEEQLANMKLQEAELAQLRGLSHEQQRSIRTGARQIESLQVSEKILQEEASNLKQLLDKEKVKLNEIQETHAKRIADLDKSWKNRLEALRNELNHSWEYKMKREKDRLQTELESTHYLEKRKLQIEADERVKQEKRELEKKLISSSEQISSLKNDLESKESSWKKEMERIQINADRDVFDLRRKLDRIDMSYQDKIEALTAKHQKEIETLKEEAEQRLASCEQNWQMQMGSTRTTLELVKEQMERAAQKRLEQVQAEYQTKLDSQWRRLNEEKENAVMAAERKFIKQLEILKEEMEKSSKVSNDYEMEHLQTTIDALKNELNSKNRVINHLQDNVDCLQGGIQVLNEEVTNHNKEIQRYKADTEQIIRKKISEVEREHIKELEALKHAHAQEALKWQSELKALKDAVKRKAGFPLEIKEEHLIKHIPSIPKELIVKSSSTSQVELPKEVDLPKVADLPHVVDQQKFDQPKVDQPIAADIPNVEEQQMAAQQLKQEDELEVTPEPSSCPTAPARRKAEGAADGSRVVTQRRNSSPCLGGRKVMAQGPSIRQGNHVDQSSNRNRSKWSLSSLLKTFAIR